jgi:hypothetical protein
MSLILGSETPGRDAVGGGGAPVALEIMPDHLPAPCQGIVSEVGPSGVAARLAIPPTIATFRDMATVGYARVSDVPPRAPMSAGNVPGGRCLTARGEQPIDTPRRRRLFRKRQSADEVRVGRHLN